MSASWSGGAQLPRRREGFVRANASRRDAEATLPTAAVAAAPGALEGSARLMRGANVRRTRVIALSVALGLSALGAPLPGGLDAASVVRADEPAPRDSERPACVDARAAPRLGAYGYDHWVEVYNRCDFSVRCEVATDVDPRPTQTLRLGPGARGEVLTRRESPARAYAPIARCSAD